MGPDVLIVSPQFKKVYEKMMSYEWKGESAPGEYLTDWGDIPPGQLYQKPKEKKMFQNKRLEKIVDVHGDRLDKHWKSIEKKFNNGVIAPCNKCGTAVFKDHAYHEARVIENRYRSLGYVSLIKHDDCRNEDDYQVKLDFYCGHCRPKPKKKPAKKKKKTRKK